LLSFENGVGIDAKIESLEKNISHEMEMAS